MRNKRFLSVMLGLAVVAWSSGLVFARPVAASTSQNNNERPSMLGSPKDIRRSGLTGEKLEQAIADQAAKLKSDNPGTANGEAKINATIGASSITGAPNMSELFVQASGTLTGLKDQASDPGGHICMIYLDTRDGLAASASGSIYARCSTNNGASFLGEARLDRSSGTGAAGVDMSIISDGAGTFYVLFNSFAASSTDEIMMVRSRDGGATWSSPMLVDTTLDPVSAPITAAATSDGKIYVAWETSAGFLMGTNIVYSYSSDFGATWTVPVIVDDAPAGFLSGFEAFPTLVLGGNGKPSIFWQSDRDESFGETDLWYSYSSDFGATWSADTRLNTTAGAGTDFLFNFDPCSDGNGNVYTLFEMTDGELYVRRSTNYGASFSDAPINITSGAPSTDIGGEVSLNCAFSGAAHRVIVALEGTLAATTDEVLVSVSSNGGASFSALSSPRLNPGHTVGGPQIEDLAADIDGNSGIYLVAWTQESASGSGFFSGYVNYSNNSGTSWQSPELLFSNAPVGSHFVSLADDEHTGANFPSNVGKGATNDNRLAFHLVWDDDRAGATGMYYGQAAFQGSNTPLMRDAGTNRRDTARKICEDAFPIAGTVSAFVVARDDKAGDALSGAPLAVQSGGCLLLTNKGSLSSEVSAEITRAFDGVDDPMPDVYIEGGTGAVATAVETAIAGLNVNIDIKRLAGSDAIDTSVKNAEELKTMHGQAPSAAFIANKDATFDALAAGAAASSPQLGNGPAPVLLNTQGSLDSRVSSYLSANSGLIKTVYMAGGSAVLGSGVKSAIDAIIDTVTQFGGSNRYHTAQLMGDFFFPTPQSIGIASGTVPWDALPGGAHSGRKVQPLLLVQPCGLPSETETYVVAHKATINGGDVYGGTAAVCDAVKTAIENRI